MRVLWKSHKRFPLVILSILPATRGTGTPASAASGDDLKPKSSPSKAPKMLHFRAPQLLVQKQTPGLPPPPAPGEPRPTGRTTRGAPPASLLRAGLPAPHQPPSVSGSRTRLSTSGDAGCGRPCCRGKEGLQQASAARGSPSPALPLASHQSTLRQHRLQTSATSAPRGPRLPPSCWPNPARRHLSHLPGDSWSPSGLPTPPPVPTGCRGAVRGRAGCVPVPLAKQGLHPAAVQGVLLAMPPSPWHTQVPQPARPRSPECPVGQDALPRYAADPAWCVPTREAARVGAARKWHVLHHGAGGCGAGVAVLPSPAEGVVCTSPALARGTM